jgi:hypothetical protein
MNNYLHLLPVLIVAHLVGDFILQDDSMARLKSSSHWVCYRHIGFYSLPFAVLLLSGLLPLWAFLAIMAQHYVQDRYALHLRWMKFYGQTPPERWPVGPLCVDQAMHLAWIACVLLFPLAA